LIFIFSCLPAQAADVSPPSIDREASERAFMTAYGFFLENRLWSCLDSLNEALRHDTFFVDVYYMRSLALRRLGRYQDAIAAMSSYLEVRQDDLRARIIIDSMREEMSLLANTLRSSKFLSSYFFKKFSTGAFFGIPMYERLSYSGMKGLGKISAMGDLLFVCDTLGDSVWFSGLLPGQGTSRIDSPLPVVVVPSAPSEAYLLQKSGDVSRIEIDSRSRTATAGKIGGIDANVADAVMIDSTLMAVADRTGQALRFYDLPSLEAAAEWRPEDSEESLKLFEPVAAAVYGPFIAVADRGNGRIYVLDSFTLTVQDAFDVDVPRDIDWGAQGEIYVVSENGELYRRFPVGMSDNGPDLITKGLDKAWSIAYTIRGPVISDISARAWWHSAMIPGGDAAFGSVTLKNPWIEERDDAKNLMLRGVSSSSFRDFIRNKLPSTQAVWRNDTRPSRVADVSADVAGTALYYSPYPSESMVNNDVRIAATISDVMADIAAVSRSGGDIPGVLVLDTRISGTDDEMGTFFGFLLHQGVRLDMWASNRPASAPMTRISRSTLGYTYYSRDLRTIPFNDGIEWIFNIPLPPDIATYGYPSEATLSIFGTIDVIQFNDWIPIWPSLISRERILGEKPPEEAQ
jgi:hypothetical protein